MCITGIGQAVLKLLSFDVWSGTRTEGESSYFGNLRFVSLKMTSHYTSLNFQTLEIEIFSKPCKI